ncbi:glycosyltransferase [Affinirhizobium pseudoryzae]|uniref:glycosyltransferase n=1 Tax=Allorhizobium pseudoryzae TaxID=379684 RepID=UPI001F31EC99|nr:glycosyltransferase [Allorhizobium pseudoryzae]
MTINVLYLAHDLSDPAIRRRVVMLKAGGAAVSVAGFLRDANRLADEKDVPVRVLGHTADGRFAQRIAAVVKARAGLARHLSGLRRPDVIIARNLETLALAKGARAQFGGSVPVVYECLDIHRLLLDDGLKGRLLRAAEGQFGRSASLLATSSPAFVEHYFKPRSNLRLPVMLLENKVLDLEAHPGLWPPIARPPRKGEPWRIGWFGAIRCRKSFAILSEFAAAMDGQVEIVIRGRVSPKEFPDFERQVAQAPHVSFHGTYRNPEDLSRIYGEVQFVWAIDFFEEGLNSEWLLPNRLYEGALHGAVPIALSSTETGRFLALRQLGLLLSHADVAELVRRFEALAAEDYLSLFATLADTDRSIWAVGRAECQALVRQLAALGSTAPAEAGFIIPSPLQSEG